MGIWAKLQLLPHLFGALLVSKRALDRGEGATAHGRGRGGGRRRRLLLGGAEGGGQEAGAGESKKGHEEKGEIEKGRVSQECF